MKKLLNIFAVILISICTLPFCVNAANIVTLDVSNNNGKLTVSGTTEDDVYAIAVLIYSGNDLVHMETCSNDNGYSCELNKSLSNGTYVVKVADYNGGDYITKEVTIKDNSLVANPKTGDKVIFSVVLGSVSFITLVGIGIYVSKKKKLSKLK